MDRFGQLRTLNKFQLSILYNNYGLYAVKINSSLRKINTMKYKKTNWYHDQNLQCNYRSNILADY